MSFLRELAWCPAAPLSHLLELLLKVLGCLLDLVPTGLQCEAVTPGLAVAKVSKHSPAAYSSTSSNGDQDLPVLWWCMHSLSHRSQNARRATTNMLLVTVLMWSKYS